MTTSFLLCLDIRTLDTFALIAALGRECAGAAVISPAGAPPPPAPTTALAAPLTDAEIEALVANLRSAPLGVTARVRLSLAGVQEKLVLTRMSDGRWGRPIDGAPLRTFSSRSFAILPGTVENEAFCMRIAKHLGLPVANVTTTSIAGRKLLVVERYDRIVRDDGAVERMHQEDICQALVYPRRRNTRRTAVESLRHVAALLTSAAGISVLEMLLMAVTFNILIGNGDAHGKNLSLLYHGDGPITLAPLYDLMCTLIYNQPRLAMYIDAVQRMNQVTTDRLVKEAGRWGLQELAATRLIADIIGRMPGAVERARAENPGVPEELLSVVHGQLTRLAAPPAR